LCIVFRDSRAGQQSKLIRTCAGPETFKEETGAKMGDANLRAVFIALAILIAIFFLVYEILTRI